MLQIAFFLLAAVLGAYLLSALTMAVVFVFDALIGIFIRQQKTERDDPDRLMNISVRAFSGGLIACIIFFALSVNSHMNFSQLGRGIVTIFVGFQLFIALNLLVYSARQPIRTAIAAILVIGGIRALLLHFNYWPGIPFGFFHEFQLFLIPGHGYLLNTDIYFFAVSFTLMIIFQRIRGVKET